MVLKTLNGDASLLGRCVTVVLLCFEKKKIPSISVHYAKSGSISQQTGAGGDCLPPLPLCTAGAFSTPPWPETFLFGSHVSVDNWMSCIIICIRSWILKKLKEAAGVQASFLLAETEALWVSFVFKQLENKLMKRKKRPDGKKLCVFFVPSSLLLAWVQRSHHGVRWISTSQWWTRGGSCCYQRDRVTNHGAAVGQHTPKQFIYMPTFVHGHTSSRPHSRIITTPGLLMYAASLANDEPQHMPEALLPWTSQWELFILRPFPRRGPLTPKPSGCSSALVHTNQHHPMCQNIP